MQVKLNNLFDERGNLMEKGNPQQSHVIVKRVGKTTYKATIHLSQTSKETMSDKITRMIKNETLGKTKNI